ncbi:MAG TPA: nucleotidyltransferase family protein [Anaerolineae bacterium]|nr:nucleotidyltransferase family protein [Anaerolineae bacterium]
MTIRSFILAGGLGTRIRSLYPDLPKPLIPIHGKPFLEHQIVQLRDQGFYDFVLCVSYRADQIVDHFQDGTAWGVRIRYSYEQEPLGTAGALRYAAPYWEDTSLVVNGDTFVNADFRTLVDAHHARSDAGGSIGLVAMPDTGRYGQVLIDAQQHVTAFREKEQSAGAGWTNAGVYVLEPSVLDLIPAGHTVSIEREIFPALAVNRQLYGFPLDGAFVDMGTPEGLAAMEALLS